jgi:hypothetical protein
MASRLIGEPSRMNARAIQRRPEGIIRGGQAFQCRIRPVFKQNQCVTVSDADGSERQG